jgi:hypothetical protein
VESTIWELEEQLLIGICNRGRHLSYQRGKRNTNPGTSLIKIEGVDDTNAAKYVQPQMQPRDVLMFYQLLPRKEGCLRLPSTERG